MNERIEELAAQAGAGFDKYGLAWSLKYPDEETGVDLEKFAKLIIKECAEYFRKEEGTAHGLEEHFGIK